MPEIIGQVKQTTVMSKERFLRTFGFVPDEKLAWSPTSTSKGSLRIAAHIGVSNQGMASVIRGEKPPVSSMQELFAMIDAAEVKITSREEAIRLIEDSTAGLLSALDALTPEKLAGEAGLPGHAMPMAQFVWLAARHMDSHAAQIDYLQTTWGDMENHF